MKILSLDLGTKTGWAFWDGARLESGVQDFTKQRGESNGMLFLKFNRWLAADFVSADAYPNLIVFEQAHHRGGAATEIGVGLMTRVLEVCALANLEHASVHSATLKKWATGKGNASKEEMICAVGEKAEIETSKIGTRLDDNEADAILLCAYAMEKFGK